MAYVLHAIFVSSSHFPPYSQNTEQQYYLGFLQAAITNVLFYVVHFLVGRGNGVGIQRGRPRARHPGGGWLEKSCVGQRQRCRICPDDRSHFHLAGTG